MRTTITLVSLLVAVCAGHAEPFRVPTSTEPQTADAPLSTSVSVRRADERDSDEGLATDDYSEGNAADSTSTHHCQPEEFRHTYVTADDESSPTTNAWPRARVGERATTRDVCLLPNGLPLTRACLFNARLGRAEWESIAHWQPISCIRRTRQRIATPALSRLHEEVANVSSSPRGLADHSQVLLRAATILQGEEYQILPADVHYMAAILGSMIERSRDAALSPHVVSICSLLMAQNSETLRLAGEINATNFLLAAFEKYLDVLRQPTSPVALFQGAAAENSSDYFETPSKAASLLPRGIESVYHSQLGVRAHLSQNISVFFVNPRRANITGIAVYEASAAAAAAAAASGGTHPLHREARGDFLYRFIHSNESVAEVLREPGLEVASFIPSSLWASISEGLAERRRSPTIVFKVYATDCLFVERSSNLHRKPSGKVLSISIPGHSGPFKQLLPFMLRNRNFGSRPPAVPANATGCGYWNYTTWLSGGIQSPANALELPVILCGSLHLTQFTFLVGGSYRQSSLSGDVLITPLRRRALDALSLAGCSLSLLGLLGIWLTAALFPRWRALATNKLLLHLCFVLTLQLLLFVFVNTNDATQDLLEHHEAIECVVLGALLQYFTLVLFSWMLIMACLQFQRYVTVIGIKRPQHYMWKSAAAAWGFPLMPTLLTAGIDPHSYLPPERQVLEAGAICYPSGFALALGVMLPITAVVSANLYVFACVCYNVSHSLRQSLYRADRRVQLRQIRLSVLLFFLLGLSWIFGVLAYMRAGVVFSYLFCLTATLQGFVLFVYFVLMDAVTRDLWRDFLCGASPTKRGGAGKNSRELRSMTTTMTVASSSRERVEESEVAGRLVERANDRNASK